MRKLILVLLVMPLIIVVATKDPHAAGQFVQLVVTVGAKVLDAVATLISNILGGH